MPRLLQTVLMNATLNATVPDQCAKTHSNDLWYVGVFLDAIATLAGTGGKQMLRFAVVKNNIWYYPVGLAMTAVIDPAFDISAYAFAAQSIISPMGAMVVVWNVLIAPCTLGETLTRSRKIGGGLIVFGTFFVGLFGNHEAKEYTVDEYLELFGRGTALGYYFVSFVWFGICGYYWRHGSSFVSGFFVGALGGSLAGNMFTTKAVVEMMACVATPDPSDPCAQSACAYNPFYTPWPYFFIFVSLTLATVSLWMLAVGLKTFEALYMITVFEGFMILSGSLSGNLVMNEKEGLPWFNIGMYTCGVAVILLGLYILCDGESRAAGGGKLLAKGSQDNAEAHMESVEMSPNAQHDPDPEL